MHECGLVTCFVCAWTGLICCIIRKGIEEEKKELNNNKNCNKIIAVHPLSNNKNIVIVEVNNKNMVGGINSNL